MSLSVNPIVNCGGREGGREEHFSHQKEDSIINLVRKTLVPSNLVKFLKINPTRTDLLSRSPGPRGAQRLGYQNQG